MLNVYIFLYVFMNVHLVFVENVFEIPRQISYNNIGDTRIKIKKHFPGKLRFSLVTHALAVVCLECAATASYFQCFKTAPFRSHTLYSVHVNITFMPLVVLFLYKFAVIIMVFIAACKNLQ